MHAPIENIWLEFGDTLKRYILKHVADEQGADDIVQDVFVKIHARIETLRDEDRLQSWVYQIARNAINDYYRKSQWAHELDENTLVDADDEDNEIEQRLSRSLRAMVDTLPNEYRQALMLTAFEGLSQKELAERLGLSVSGAKSRVQRASEAARLLPL